LNLKLQSEIDDEILLLKNNLARSTNGNPSRQFNSFEKGTESREHIEIYNAALNFHGVVERELEKLSKNPTNYELAVETYTLMITLASYVMAMQETFIDRIDNHYYPGVIDNMSKVTNRKNALLNDHDAPDSLKLSSLERLDFFESVLQELTHKLPVMKTQTEERIVKINRYIKNLTHLNEEAKLANNLATSISSLRADLSLIPFDLPEVVEYKINVSDFKI
jgi:hypothetical protein